MEHKSSEDLTKERDELKSKLKELENTITATQNTALKNQESLQQYVNDAKTKELEAEKKVASEANEIKHLKTQLAKDEQDKISLSMDLEKVQGNFDTLLKQKEAALDKAKSRAK